MGILYSKDRPRSRSESRPCQRQLAQKHAGGNGLILPSHMQSQLTREAMWQSEDPERLQTYMKVSAMPSYRTLPGENEEKNVTFLLPQYNRTWAAERSTNSSHNPASYHICENLSIVPPPMQLPAVPVSQASHYERAYSPIAGGLQVSDIDSEQRDRYSVSSFANALTQLDHPFKLVPIHNYTRL